MTMALTLDGAMSATSVTALTRIMTVTSGHDHNLHDHGLRTGRFGTSVLLRMDCGGVVRGIDCGGVVRLLTSTSHWWGGVSRVRVRVRVVISLKRVVEA